MINYGSINTHQGLEPVYGLARVTDFFNFTGDGWSVGYNAGILWQPYKTISIGATFRSSARLNFTGHTSFRDTTTSYNKPTSWDASASFNFPLTVVAGLSYRPTPKWNLEFDANYTDWSSFDNVSIKQPPTVTSTGFPVQNVPMNLDWQGSWMYELGVTRYFGKGWHVSAGYAFNQNSVPNTYYTPLAADLDRNFVSLGAGFKGRRFDFDIAYQAGFAWDHTVSGSTSSTKAITATSGETANGTYGFSSQAVFVTAGVHF
jgi:long-chain fatty acid transport protein